MSDKIKVITHSSKFHTDDIFAVATLVILLGRENVDVIRSREMDIIKKGDYVVDVGEVYDVSTNRFDHHQKGGAGVRNNGVPYAAFGLVWKTFGETLCGSKEVMEEVDRVLIQPLDAGDNGMEFLETKVDGLHQFDIGSLTYIFSPTWKEESENLDTIFLKLVSYAVEVLKRQITVGNHNAEGKKFVLEAYESAIDKRIIEVDERYPWEEVLNKFPEPLFVIYKKRIDNTWSIKTIREDIFSYTPRKKLPESWSGKNKEDLEKVIGITDLVFCHNNLFMAVAKSKESVLKIAEITLNS